MQNTVAIMESKAAARQITARTNLDIEYFFDCSCVWAYLALEQLQRLAEELNLGIIVRPVGTAEVFAQVNAAVAWELPPIKQDYYEQDLKAWAAYLDLPIVGGAATVIDSGLCMLACAGAVRWGRGHAFAAAAFEAAWSQGRDIADASVVADLWSDAGLPPDALAATLAWPDVAQDLRANARELMERGGFGVPTFFLQDEMFFGNDAFPLLEGAVRSALRSSGYTF